MPENEEYYEFKFYKEWTEKYRGKHPTYFIVSRNLENEPWFYNLSFAEVGVFFRLAMLSLRTSNQIPCSKMWLKRSCSQHGGISLFTTLNKFEDLGLFLRRKCALKGRVGYEGIGDARSGFVGGKMTDDELRKQRAEIARKFSIK